MSAPVLEMRGISKAFGGNAVLSGIDLSLYAGEVHALVGENGAGKSTLMKILNGVYPMDSGTVRIGGSDVKIRSPHEARRAGISMIYQENTLANHLTVAENIFLGQEPVTGAGLLNNRRAEGDAGEILTKHNFRISPSTPVWKLTRAQKQLVEIARALASATRVVVMDEPTAVLSHSESEALFSIIEDLIGRGLAVVYISHRMEELARLAHRVTILRDGKLAYTGAASEIDAGGIVRHMAGREINELYPARGEPADDIALEARGVSDGKEYQEVSFELRKGEILGIAGMVGSGRTALARGLFGLAPLSHGNVFLNGKPVEFSNGGTAIAAGMGFLTEDRKATGIFSHLPVAQNISMAALEGQLLDGADEVKRARELMQRLSIKARSEMQPIGRLSGGNQQKALIARWLYAGSNILLLDEPTQGVDLGARAEIYKLMKQFTDGGGAILMISSDLPELLGMSHRIGVMRRGEFVALLDAATATQETILQEAVLN